MVKFAGISPKHSASFGPVSYFTTPGKSQVEQSPKPWLLAVYRGLGGGFKSFLFSPLFGEGSFFDEYFSKGLKPPTRGLYYSLVFRDHSNKPSKKGSRPESMDCA